MPMSSVQGKDWTRDRIHDLAQRHGPLRILDVGPGVGTYARLLAGPDVAHITGLEVWEPYLTTYHLHDYYDVLVVGDVRTTQLPEVDVVILGDVLEHMHQEEAVEVWRRAAQAARVAVYLSLPVVHYPQHAIEDNPFEVHVEEDWDADRVLEAFEGIGARWVGSEVGVFERLTQPTAPVVR